MTIENLLQTLTCHENVSVVLAWLAWRQDQLLPHRDQIHHASIKKSLPWITIHQPIDENTSTLRLVGSNIVEMLGQDPTGRNHKDITAPADWKPRIERALRMTSVPCGGYATFTALGAASEGLDFEAVNLPLDHDDQGHRLILSCTVPRSQRYLPEPGKSQTIEPTASFKFVDLGAGI